MSPPADGAHTVLDRATGTRARPREVKATAHAAAGPGRVFWRVDLPLLLLASAVFGMLLSPYAFDTVLSEWDLYLAAIGLWDGYHSGEGLGGTTHYGKWHSFGYILLVYALAPPEIFGPGFGLFRFMNALGFWATIACLPLSWMALATGCGRRVAWPATAIFIGSPVFLEIAGGAHPLLLAMAAFLLGAILLWWPARGMAGLALKVGAAAVLSLALTLRLEVILAFPFLVLATSSGEDLPAFIRTALVRIGVTAAACAAFVILQSQLIPPGHEKSTEFLAEWYRAKNIPIGVMAATLAVGTASLLCFGWSVLAASRGTMRGGDRTAALAAALPYLGPLSLVLTAAVFWIPNPLPARHFLLMALGVAVIIALVSSVRLRFRSALFLALGLVVANQVISGLANPVLVEKSGFAAHRNWPYLLTAPSGLAWERRAMLKRKWAASFAAGQVIASGQCGDKLVVSAQLEPAIVAAFVSQRSGARASRHSPTYDREGIDLVELADPVHALIYTRPSLLEPPFPAALIADPGLAEYGFVVVSDQPVAADASHATVGRPMSQGCLRLGT